MYIKVLKRYIINKFGMAVAGVAFVIPLLFASCGSKDKQFASAITSRDSTAVMITRGISSFISEKGVTRYRIETEEWNMFDQANPPYQAFEKGMYLEVYDSLMNVTSTVRSDTAYYYDNTEVWELRGHVHAQNVDNDQFDTELLFWNQRTEKVYSDAAITVSQAKQILHGKGFDSNQNFTRYTIRKTDGIFPVKDEPADSVRPARHRVNAGVEPEPEPEPETQDENYNPSAF